MPANGATLIAADSCSTLAASVSFLVSAYPSYRGVDDEIAGCFSRYTFGGLRQRIEESGTNATHVVGFTYPILDLLYPLSEYLVRAHRMQQSWAGDAGANPLVGKSGSAFQDYASAGAQDPAERHGHIPLFISFRN
jgi:hypothetical protein